MHSKEIMNPAVFPTSDRIACRRNRILSTWRLSVIEATFLTNHFLPDLVYSQLDF